MFCACVCVCVCCVCVCACVCCVCMCVCECVCVVCMFCVCLVHLVHVYLHWSSLCSLYLCVDSFPIKVNDRYFEEYYDLVEVRPVAMAMDEHLLLGGKTWSCTSPMLSPSSNSAIM